MKRRNLSRQRQASVWKKGMSWQTMQELSSWHSIFRSSHWDSFEGWVPVDFNDGCPIFIWVEETCPQEMIPGGCFTNVSRALQYILLKFVYCRNCSFYQNFKLKLCTCAQSMALGTPTKFQLEILTINVISGIVYFREFVLESSRNISETTTRI